MPEVSGRGDVEVNSGVSRHLQGGETLTETIPLEAAHENELRLLLCLVVTVGR